MKERHSLDGRWEFLPLVGGSPAGSAVEPPRDGYERTPILVPGYWNVLPEAIGGDWGAYDHYGYPPHWRTAAAGWYRRRFALPPVAARAGVRTRLCFDAVAGRATVWLDGRRLGGSDDSFLPFALDITGLARPGCPCELAVLVEPPETKDGLWLQPCGSWVGWHLRGIWQPVYLETTPASAVRDIFVQPSVRRAELVVDVTVDPGGDAAPLEVRAGVLAGRRCVLDLGRRPVPAGGGPQTVRFRAARPGLALWSPRRPRLYHLRAELRAGPRVLHVRQVRFGFREFWIEGTGLRLNGEPLRLFGDSWHYMGAAQQNPAYARTWYEFLRATGANAVRTHAMPYPPLYFDLADELGMLVVAESAVYGSAGTLALADETFWARAADHVRRMVLRDRNHPSIILWSACNETVWKGGPQIFPKLRALGAAAQAADPTRPVSYDENDSDLGGGAPVHSGHYGTPAHWERAWQRTRPLVVHEFSSLYHGGPDEAAPIGDDAVYADFSARLAAAGEDAADMFLRLRRLGAASITPWNLNWYCLEPLPPAAVERVPAALTAGGAPLRRIGARSLPFNFGYLPGAPAWRPNAAYAPLAACYRRQRCFVPRRPRQGFGGRGLRLDVEVWNDTGRAADLVLAACLRRAGRPTHAERRRLTVQACSAARVNLRVKLPAVRAHEVCALELALRAGSRRTPCHVESWPVHVYPARPAARGSRRPAWVVGAPTAPRALRTALGLRGLRDGGLPAMRRGEPAAVLLAGPAAGRTWRDWLGVPEVEALVAGGGRLIVLPGALTDDDTSALAPLRRPCHHAFPRADDPLLRGLAPEHFRDWGPDGVVAEAVFQRPATGPAVALLDAGDPAEGLAHAPLVLVPHGRGHIVLSGMDLLKRAADTPAAAILLDRLLHAELGPPPAGRVAVVAAPDHPLRTLLAEVGVADAGADADVLICDGGARATLAAPRLAESALGPWLARGGTLLVLGLEPPTADAWARRLDLPLRLGADERCNLARAAGGPLLAGLNNFDFCWVSRGTGQPIVTHTLERVPAAFRTFVQTVATRWEGYQTAAEQHKVALMIRRLEQFAGPRAAVIEARRGRGRIIISQLRLPEARDPFRARAQRILSRWLDACGAARAAAASPLAPRPRPVVDAAGYITQWLVLGPFAGATGHPLDHAFVDEATLKPAEGARAGGRTWRLVRSPWPQVDLSRVLAAAAGPDRVAYAAVHVYAPRDCAALLAAPDMVALLAGADGGLKVLVNGRPVGRFDFVRSLALDSDRVDGLPLRAGWNTLVLKLHHRAGPWRFAARLWTPAGRPPGDVAVALAPGPAGRG